MVAGTPWVASCTVTVDADSVETCSGPEAADSLAYAAFGDHGTREFFTHVRFHKHEDDQIVVHLLVELYARSNEEATQVLEEAARGQLTITSLAEESRPPAATGDHPGQRVAGRDRHNVVDAAVACRERAVGRSVQRRARRDAWWRRSSTSATSSTWSGCSAA